MNDLEMYREQLALCDDRIIDALVERNSIVEKIMAYKEEYGMPILQPLQEKKQKRRLEEKLTHNKLSLCFLIISYHLPLFMMPFFIIGYVKI